MEWTAVQLVTVQLRLDVPDQKAAEQYVHTVIPLHHYSADKTLVDYNITSVEAAD